MEGWIQGSRLVAAWRRTMDCRIMSFWSFGGSEEDRKDLQFPPKRKQDMQAFILKG